MIVKMEFFFFFFFFTKEARVYNLSESIHPALTEDRVRIFWSLERLISTEGRNNVMGFEAIL